MIDKYRLDDDGRYEFAVSVIREAGDLALRFFDNLKDLVIEKKGHQDLVSQADKEVELYIRESLGKAFPEDQIIGEEGGNTMPSDSQKSEFVWVIDPIDGTKNFINGNGNFGTLISLCIDRSPVIGIINCPDIKKTWIGIKDNGAFCNGKKIKKSQNNLNLSKLYFSTSGMTAFKSNNKNKKYNALIKKTKYATFGGDCVQYGLLAEKRIPFVVESFLKPFDYLPLVNVIEETGGIITDWHGKSLNFQSNGDVVASISAKAHKQFLKL